MLYQRIRDLERELVASAEGQRRSELTVARLAAEKLVLASELARAEGERARIGDAPSTVTARKVRARRCQVANEDRVASSRKRKRSP